MARHANAKGRHGHAGAHARVVHRGRATRVHGTRARERERGRAGAQSVLERGGGHARVHVRGRVRARGRGGRGRGRAHVSETEDALRTARNQSAGDACYTNYATYLHGHPARRRPLGPRRPHPHQRSPGSLRSGPGSAH